MLLKFSQIIIGTGLVFEQVKIVLMKTKFYPYFLTLICLISSAVLHGQTVCNNELIHFRETFGNAPLMEAYEEGRTGFKFMSGAQLESGEYAVNGNSQLRPEWHNSPDHTGDVNGQMIIINPGQADGDFYCDSISGLTTAGNYSVSFYVLNVNQADICGAGAVLPKIRIEIEYLLGAISYAQLSSFTTNPIPITSSPAWVKITSGFVLPAGVTEIRYRLINSSIGDCGNSLAIDDITFSQCSSLSTLPVKGLKINSVEAISSGTRILFSTTSESQTDRMITQKSTDGISWIDSYTQPAAVNSDRIINYTSTDNQPYAQVTYYRIKQTDLKGGESFSAIVKYSAANLSNNTLNVYPTPFISQLHLNFTSQKNETFTATLFSAEGLALQRIPVLARKGNNLVEFNTVQLKQGTYLVTVSNNDGSIRLSQKTVKQ